MPIRMNRTADFESQLERLNYAKGVNLKEDAVTYLYTHPNHFFSADEMLPRLDTAASAVQLESVLSNNPHLFKYGKKDGQLYWQLVDSSVVESLL